jgi:hypothetical protein
MTPPASAGAMRNTAGLAPGRIATPPPRPRRVSGPARTPVRNAPSASPSQQGLARAALDALETLSTHHLLDRLIRSRVWIGLVAFALIGIVTLQLGMLKLNSGIGRSLEREQTFQRENSALSIENSELAGGDRVETEAKKLGMSLVPEQSLMFLSAGSRADVAHAVKALQTPVVATPPTPAPATTETSSEDKEASSGSAETSSSGGSTTYASSETQTQSQEAPSTTQSEGTAPAPSGESGSSTAPVEEASADGGTAAAPTG